MQNELVVADVNRVTGIRATLVASHDVRFLGQNIDDLALALVTPLAADHHQAAAIYTTFGHDRLSALSRPQKGAYWT
jgi:hypothetical protein